MIITHIARADAKPSAGSNVLTSTANGGPVAVQQAHFADDLETILASGDADRIERLSYLATFLASPVPAMVVADPSSNSSANAPFEENT
jgi:hypothetical protein